MPHPKPRKQTKFEPRYAGKLSNEFWERVKNIPWSEEGQAIYALGCALQDLEHRLLVMLYNAEKKRGGR